MKHLACLLCLLILPCAGFAQSPVFLDHPFGSGLCDKGLKDGDLLHGVADLGLVTWDVSDPLHPVRLSIYPFASRVFAGQIVKSGSTVYMRKDRSVVAMDMSDPTAPIGQLLDLGEGIAARSIAVQEDLLYVATGYGLMTFDVSDPATPMEVDFMPLFYLEHIVRVDSVLLGGTGFSYHRIGLGTGLPVLLDTIVEQSGSYGLFDTVCNDRQAFVSLHDPMMGQWRLQQYDLSVVGDPVLVSDTPIEALNAGSLFLLTDSVLIMGGEQLVIRSVVDNQVSVVTDTLTSPFAYPTGIAWDEHWIFAFDVQGRLSVFERSSAHFAHLHSLHRVGGYLDGLEATANGQLVTLEVDSLMIFSKEPGPDGRFPYRSHPFQGFEWAVHGDLLLQTRLAGPNSITLWRIEPDGVIDSLCTFTAGNGPIEVSDILIHGDRVYTGRIGGQGSHTDIHDISDPTDPVLLVEDLALVFHAGYGDMLFTELNEQGLMEVYDATSTPPFWIGTEAYTVGCLGRRFWDQQRPRLHVVHGSSGLNSCYSCVEVGDVSDIHSTTAQSFAPVVSWEPDATTIWNDVLYIPSTASMNLHAYDVCDPAALDLMSIFPINDHARSIAAVDSFLFIAFAGYITRYDVSSLVTCTGLGERELAPGKSRLLLEPNPSTGRFKLFAPGVKAGEEVRFHNVAGDLVHVERYTASDRSGQFFDLSLPEGLYLVSMGAPGRMLTGKLLLH